MLPPGAPNGLDREKALAIISQLKDVTAERDRLAGEDAAKEDLRDLTHVVSRIATDSGRRVALDDVIATSALPATSSMN